MRAAENLGRFSLIPSPANNRSPRYQEGSSVDASTRSIWVLEGFGPGNKVTRWELPDLSDDMISRHLGFVPEGLWPPSSSLLAALRSQFGVDVGSQQFDDLLIRKESLSPDETQ